MEQTDIVSGNKEALIGEFKELYSVHGRKWRTLLKAQNDWHKTERALIAWQNIGKGTVGNEALRLIISDMKAVIRSASKPVTRRRQGLVKTA